jgi:hypothetical protein
VAEQANRIFILPNGTVAVFDNDGQQIEELQGTWIDFEYLKKIAQIIVKDNPRVDSTNVLFVARDSLLGYVKHYRKMNSCSKCEHPEEDHNYSDGQGCHGIASYEPETNGYERCHCGEFVKND